MDYEYKTVSPSNKKLVFFWSFKVWNENKNLFFYLELENLKIMGENLSMITWTVEVRTVIIFKKFLFFRYSSFGISYFILFLEFYKLSYSFSYLIYIYILSTMLVDSRNIKSFILTFVSLFYNNLRGKC